MAQLAIMRQMSRQVSHGSAGEYQADEQASPELRQDLETDFWRAQTEACAPGPRRKEQRPHRRLAQAWP